MTETDFDYEARVKVHRPAPGYLAFINDPDSKYPSYLSLHQDEFSDMFGADVTKELNDTLFTNASVWLTFGFRIE